MYSFHTLPPTGRGRRSPAPSRQSPNPQAGAAEVVEICENQDLAEALGSLAVPQTFINGIFTGAGLQPEEVFVDSLLTLKEPGSLSEEITPGEPVEKDLVIIGGR